MINMVAISGRSNSLFTSRMGDPFRETPYSPRMGQTGVGNYTQTKSDVAVWDSLVARLQRVANQTVRNQIAAQFGISDPTNTDKGQYMRNRSAKDVALAESVSPPDYTAFDPSTPGPTKNDAKDLESFISDFQPAVQNAENTYGTVAAPQVITQLVPGALPVWVLPVAVGVVGLGLLGAFGVIKI